MTFQLAISTMNKSKDEIITMVSDMNVKCDCLIINQCSKNSEEEFMINDSQKINIINSDEIGLSRSRNLALIKASADIIGIADDDLFYYENFQDDILSFYENNSDADIVLFNIDDWERSYSEKNFKCRFINLSRFTSMQITIRRCRVNVCFNELFGSGSGCFSSGEENIFLADSWKAKNNIYYCAKKILKREKRESSWFKGYNDEKFISDRGAIYYAISRVLFLPYIIRFVFIKRKLYYPLSMRTVFL